MKTLMLVSLALLANMVNAADVQRLNDILKKQNATWFAKETAVGQLSRPEQLRRLGLAEEENVVQFTKPEYQTKALPAGLDWRNKDGLNWVSPILDQGNCGSCVAFAAIGVLETQYKIASGLPTFNVKLSTQNVFACGGGACEYGWYPESAARFLQREGATDEACHPYTSGATGQDVACESSCSDRSKRTVRLASYSTPSRRMADLNANREALQRGPLVTTLYVYEDFMNYGGGIYKHVTGKSLGGHAVSIVGYDDAQRAYIIRNSWGPTWGENGFGRVSYDDVSGVGDQTWSYVMPALTGSVTIQQPIDYAYLSGVSAFNAEATYKNVATIDMTVFDAKGVISSTPCAAPRCASVIDTTKLPDGRYEVQATARDANGVEIGKSTRQLFYVANQTPQLTLAFQGINGTDLDRPLGDRIEVAVTASSSTVPMSSVEFHWQGADGIDHSRAANVVVPGLTMGWRTNLVPNGAYQIWMVGRVKTATAETVVQTPPKTVQVRN